MSRSILGQQSPTTCEQGSLLVIWFSFCVFWEMTHVQVKHSAGQTRVPPWLCRAMTQSASLGMPRGCAWPDTGKTVLRNLLLKWKYPCEKPVACPEQKSSQCKTTKKAKFVPVAVSNTGCPPLPGKYQQKALQERTAWKQEGGIHGKTCFNLYCFSLPVGWAGENQPESARSPVTHSQQTHGDMSLKFLLRHYFYSSVNMSLISASQESLGKEWMLGHMSVTAHAGCVDAIGEHWVWWLPQTLWCLGDSGTRGPEPGQGPESPVQGSCIASVDTETAHSHHLIFFM